MKNKAIFLFAMMGLVLLAGCEPNVYNEAPGSDASLETTPRPRSEPEEPPLNPTDDLQDSAVVEAFGDNTPTAPVVTPKTPEIPAIVPETPAITPETIDEPPSTAPAFAFEQMPLSSLSSEKVGWGLGRAVDSLNRPVDALTAQNKYGWLGGVFIDTETDNKIYLTFDEGYENGLTPKILDALRDAGVKATFFVTYDYCKSVPELITRMINEGHEVANHSYSHPSLPEQDDERVTAEIQNLHDYVKENFNYEMRLIRFPMGEFCERTLKIAQDLGYRSVFWSFAYVDWQVDSQPNPTEALNKITAATHPGAVYLLHAVSETNAEILPQVLEFWLDSGFIPALFD
ncbi:MAG: polysaccharide deacetylase family protein [Oscillospiraceae bacterium]|nr:polysaccharide deacetylase family protein [Oscillospiraceae bacterium]